MEVKGNMVPEGTTYTSKITASAQFNTIQVDYESAASQYKVADLYDGDDQLAVGSEIKISTGWQRRNPYYK